MGTGPMFQCGYPCRPPLLRDPVFLLPAPLPLGRSLGLVMHVPCCKLFPSGAPGPTEQQRHFLNEQAVNGNNIHGIRLGRQAVKDEIKGTHGGSQRAETAGTQAAWARVALRAPERVHGARVGTKAIQGGRRAPQRRRRKAREQGKDRKWSSAGSERQEENGNEQPLSGRDFCFRLRIRR